MTLPFSYAQKPARARSGMVADFNMVSTDSMILQDATGTSSGKGTWRVAGVPVAASVKVGVRAAGMVQVQQFAGFVVYNPGLPGDPALAEYADKSIVPVCVQGRQWLYCENFGGTDPAVAQDSWSIRLANGDPGAIGNLCYNQMGGDFFGLSQGRMRAVESVTLSGGASLVLLDFNLRVPPLNLSFPPYMNFRGAYAGGTSYNMGDVVVESGGLAPGTYVNIYNMGNTMGVLPSSDPTRWTIIG